MNDKLKELYESKWEGLLSEASKLKPEAANPLLIKVDPSYPKADIKVMVVGQETDGWYGKLNSADKTVDMLMNGYFEYFYQISKNGKNRGNRAFWNRKNFRYFECELSKYFKDKSISFVWNNISKIGNAGKNKGKAHGDIKALERSHFSVIKSEFEILKPDIVIFTTGSSRDSYIKYHFGQDIDFEPKLSLLNGSLSSETLNLIAEIKIPQFKNTCFIRIEHPNRRTLNNSISLSIIKSVFENKT